MRIMMHCYISGLSVQALLPVPLYCRTHQVSTSHLKNTKTGSLKIQIAETNSKRLQRDSLMIKVASLKFCTSPGEHSNNDWRTVFFCFYFETVSNWLSLSLFTCLRSTFICLFCRIQWRNKYGNFWTDTRQSNQRFWTGGAFSCQRWHKVYRLLGNFFSKACWFDPSEKGHPHNRFFLDNIFHL